MIVVRIRCLEVKHVSLSEVADGSLNLRNTVLWILGIKVIGGSPDRRAVVQSLPQHSDLNFLVERGVVFFVVGLNAQKVFSL